MVTLGFCTMLVVCGAMAFSAWNPVHSVSFLVLAFINSSAILVQIGAEYLALVFLIVYVGGVSILFIFVMMMLNIKEVVESRARYLPIVGVMIPLVAGQFLPLPERVSEEWVDWGTEVVSYTNLERIGVALYGYTDWVWIGASILLLAMVGAIELALDHRKQVARQSLAAQVATSAESRLFRWQNI